MQLIYKQKKLQLVFTNTAQYTKIINTSNITKP